jgi:hypothetical protein
MHSPWPWSPDTPHLPVAGLLGREALGAAVAVSARDAPHALALGAYTRPHFGSTYAPFVGYAGWLHSVSVTKTAQVELRSGRVYVPAWHTMHLNRSITLPFTLLCDRWGKRTGTSVSSCAADPADNRAILRIRSSYPSGTGDITDKDVSGSGKPQ